MAWTRPSQLDSVAWTRLCCAESAEWRRANSARSSRVISPAADRYAIDLTVLNKLGDLTSEAGGPEARKAVSERKKKGVVVQTAVGMDRPYTDQEREWIKETVRLLTKRLGEHAAQPTGITFKKLEMADLPPL